MRTEWALSQVSPFQFLGSQFLTNLHSFRLFQGMDNMFIIVEALEAVDPDIQGDERLVKAMKHIGGKVNDIMDL